LTKNQQQLFKTTDIVSIYLALIFAFIVSIKLSWGSFVPEYSMVVKKEAIVNAYQILELEYRHPENVNFFGTKKIKEKREIASIGGFERRNIIGKDPWDDHFFYEIKRLSNTKMQIIVWSSGPDKKNNSADTIPNFSGDDIGESLVVNF
jgi:hypothetical protein